MAIDDEDVPEFLKNKALAMPQPMKVADWSVEQMQHYIGWLEEEKARIEQVINERHQQKLVAQQLFKSV